MYKSKTEQQFRVEWENDIPICTGLESNQQWRDINWKQVERVVYKLQTRIYKAKSRGDYKAVCRLQKTLINSRSAKLLATRKVTQDNRGKKTAGVDGVKSLSPEARLKLAGQLQLTDKSRRTRRVWIPKSNSEKRPLGIPTMRDRATQALAKLALEPEWEAVFEENSYGFRPGRSCHDAIVAIYIHINQKPRYVLDADIAKCFDKINHQALLKKINSFPRMQKQIEVWLKSGVMDGNQLFTTEEGTPQGGVISPLLANIALHGLEKLVKEYVKSIDMKDVNGYKIRPRDKVKATALIRYADDFVCMHEEKEVVEGCQRIISEWLAQMGLELKPSKTRICHTLEVVEDQIGFNFLGFNIRQYPTGKYRSARNSNGNPLGFNTLITPSKEKRATHQKELGAAIDRHLNGKQSELILELNPIIRGWSNYYSHVVSQETFSQMDYLIWQKLKRWAIRRCQKSNRREIFSRYWKTIGTDNWRFCTAEGLKLAKHGETEITRFVKVQGNRSVYDGDFTYWGTRLGKHPEIPMRMARLLQKQKGKCAYCGHYFKQDDVMEIDHIKPKSQGGKDQYDNFQLLHRHCHDTKTASDGSYGACVKSLVKEEPDEVKVSSPVLNQRWGE
jgi:RNA-directed DNA polymerase